MSASRDKSQGMGFVYHFPNKKPVESVKEVNIGHVDDRLEALEAIRKNLDRLEELNGELDALMAEIKKP